MKVLIRRNEEMVEKLRAEIASLSGTELPDFIGQDLRLLVNGRIQVAPARINRMVNTALEKANNEDVVSYQRAETAYYRPRIESRTTR
ncbi:MAG: hypothetical protein E4H27_09980 [Anaerolineales bacterium]|nr:MAG: hypothetical protein E4H27_09980 [Anaerolineales bacterium]